MITTQVHAKEIFAKLYKGMKVKLTKQVMVGVRPVYETQIGLPTLAWRKLATGPRALVWIGQLTSSCSIDWNWRE